MYVNINDIDLKTCKHVIYFEDAGYKGALSVPNLAYGVYYTPIDVSSQV